MVYSDVKKQGYFKEIEEKEKYTMNDVKKLIHKHVELTINQAIFIIKCVAINYDKQCSETLYSYNSEKNALKRMF